MSQKNLQNNLDSKAELRIGQDIAVNHLNVPVFNLLRLRGCRYQQLFVVAWGGTNPHQF